MAIPRISVKNFLLHFLPHRGAHAEWERGRGCLGTQAIVGVATHRYQGPASAQTFGIDPGVLLVLTGVVQGANQPAGHRPGRRPGKRGGQEPRRQHQTHAGHGQ